MYRSTRPSYPSDLSDAEWSLLGPLLAETPDAAERALGLLPEGASIRREKLRVRDLIPGISQKGRPPPDDGSSNARTPGTMPRFAQIKQARNTVEDELARIESRAAHIERLEPGERNQIYKMLDITVLAHDSGSLDLKWALGAAPCRDNEPRLPGGYRIPGR